MSIPFPDIIDDVENIIVKNYWDHLWENSTRFGPTWTLDPTVKPWSTLKKEPRKVVETSEEKDEEFPREYWTLYPVYLKS